MQIEHDPDEPPPDRTGNWPYWAGAITVAVIWIITLLTHVIDWQSAALGGLTAGVFVIVLIEYTGNKVPKWMR